MTEEPELTPLEPQVAGQPSHPLVDFSDADLALLFQRAVRVTAVLGVVIALVLWAAMSWRAAALFAVGAVISIASIYEWSRLIKLFNASLDQQKTPRGAGLVVTMFLLRLILFAGVIYVSLKSLHGTNSGSPYVLVCGLALAVAGLVWEAMRLLRG
jgi:hypothetical protein